MITVAYLAATGKCVCSIITVVMILQSSAQVDGHSKVSSQGEPPQANPWHCAHRYAALANVPTQDACLGARLAQLSTTCQVVLCICWCFSLGFDIYTHPGSSQGYPAHCKFTTCHDCMCGLGFRLQLASLLFTANNIDHML